MGVAFIVIIQGECCSTGQGLLKAMQLLCEYDSAVVVMQDVYELTAS